jgi:hypothetical protein
LWNRTVVASGPLQTLNEGQRFTLRSPVPSHDWMIFLAASKSYFAPDECMSDPIV